MADPQQPPFQPLQTPVVLIAFRRPDVTQRNLDVLRRVQPEQLFIVADGPRPGRPDEAEKCAEVRALIDQIDWPVKVERKFAERNLGLEANVELGLDWVFSQVDRAIVLEDDCIPDPSFFRYADELLTRYADEKRVWQIGGDTHLVPKEMFHGHSYGFSTWASVWGWATWADRWHDHRSEFNRDHAGAEDRVDQTPRTADAQRTHVAVPHPDALVTEAARKHFTFVSTEPDGDRYGWDHHWWVTIMSRQGLSIMPCVNLVEHDGYGEGATHTRAAKDPVPADALEFPLQHPPTVELNEDAERELELVLLRTDGRLSRLARKLIRPLWMRAMVRRVLEVPIVWRVVRRLVGQ
ncbi:glycosyltransferase family 2 protein [Nocardioides humilatus]|uniref:Glycosyltransferase family 2 protein n=1 Tax=Nocardioides humilatus TaxID=2607660 RepID=A0A5B1LL55_9ACTN|nr:glycosyltransferase family 2 protein [Nocardioides humilatus]KAA1421461.1 glycosyltransferase family 2 protein [Nocardioides humilatus]